MNPRIRTNRLLAVRTANPLAVDCFLIVLLATSAPPPAARLRLRHGEQFYDAAPDSCIVSLCPKRDIMQNERGRPRTVSSVDFGSLVVKRKYVLFDGAWGTLLVSGGRAAGDAPERLNLTDPQKVTDAARSYIRAGSDMIITNTFGGSRLKLAFYGLADSAREINTAAARISKSGRRLPPGLRLRRTDWLLSRATGRRHRRGDDRCLRGANRGSPQGA